MSGIIYLPQPEVMIDKSGWDFAENKQRRVLNFLFEPLATLLLQAVEEAVSMAKILARQSYPPPSVPGEPPHQRTGRLWDSIDIFSATKKYIVFGADAPYAGFLEFGTSKMMPRPFMTPAILAMIEKFPLTVVGEMQKI